MTEELAAEARRLRREDGLSAREIRQRLGVGRDRLYEWLRGVPSPDWTRRPNAKDELRARAEHLRRDGWSVPEIAVELGVARSTAYQWTKHIPLREDSERACKRREHSKRMTDAQWAAHRTSRARERASAHAAAAKSVGQLSDRELLLVGAATYWCEGAKRKPWRPEERLIFTNSDPVLVEIFLSFVEMLGMSRTELKYRVSIHESADVAQATDWWAQQVRVPPECFQRPTFKRHVPSTGRRNVGDGYRGCLVVTVPRGRELYWRIEGTMEGLHGAVVPREVG